MSTPSFRPIVLSAAVAAIGLTGFASLAAWREARAARTISDIGPPDPYALMKGEFFARPDRFEIALARGAAAGAHRNLADAQLMFVDRAVVSNLGTALRAIVGYRAEIPGSSGTLSLDAELRQYFHPRGTVVIEAACPHSGTSSRELGDLTERTEATVVQHLSDEGVGSLLPAGAACETSPAPLASHVNHVTVCRLGPDVRLSVMRLSLEQTLAEFRQLAVDPGSQAIGGQVVATREP
jgi:hypothetical protein